MTKAHDRAFKGSTLSVFLAVLGCFCAGTDAAPARFAYERVQMATRFRIVLYANDETLARGAAVSAFERIEQLESRMSDYREDSELLTAVEGAFESPQILSEDLFGVLQLSLVFSRLTSGAFDITVKPLARLWKDSIRGRILPTPEQIDEARRKVGYENVLLNPRTRSLRLGKEGVEIDLGGIAKGFAADEAWKVLNRAGFPCAMVDAGGDLRLGTAPPGRRGWKVEVEDGVSKPLKLVLAECGIATSGDLYQSAEIGAVRYSHIVDPKTGIGLTNHRVVTVIAPETSTADALATALSILEPDSGFRVLKALPRTSARIVNLGGTGPQLMQSPGFPP